jgi:tRNA pseudouridine32 synthase / 23S rRNA pseudouridine746 synthase
MRTYRATASAETQRETYEALLVKASKLSPAMLADAAAKGAVWIQRKSRGKTLRLRNLTGFASPLDSIIFYHDARILSYPAISQATCIGDNKHYGVWLKQAGVMAQGTQTGDHTSLLRFVEIQKNKEVFLVHRIDRETEGLMLLAYSSEAAAKLSELFQKNLIRKTYQAIVLGEIERGYAQTINDSLDGKEAITHLHVLSSKEGKSLLELTIETGRLHQIRRHLDGIGFPIIGDPLYGKGNKNRDGLKLLAQSLEFCDPWTKEQVKFHLSSSLTF